MGNTDYLDTSLPLKKRIKNLVSQLTLEEKIGLIPTSQAEIPRLNIKEYSYGTEIARGYVGRDDAEVSTVFPQPIGLASMFDTELMEKLGEIAGTEIRYYEEHSKGHHLVLFGPTVDLARDPRWGRTEECYGEDPYLAGQCVKAYTKGIVGNKPDYFRAIPSLKHFYANNNEKDRCSSNSNITPRTKYEYYYRAFRPAIEAGYAPGVMTSYNSINGLPAMINPDIDEVCKKQWGMKFAVTDGGDMTQTVTHHKFTKNHGKTIAMALKSGTDIMCDDAELVMDSIRYALNKGLLTEKELDKAVINALYPRFLAGEFNPPENNPYLDIPESTLNCFKYKVLNLQAAREAITLLKNNGILPLKKERIHRLAVLGVHANTSFPDWYTGRSSYNITILDGFKSLLPDSEIVYEDCRDIVAIRSVETGNYLKVNDDDTVTANGTTPNDIRCQFVKDDWGGEITLTSVKNGKYLTTEGSEYKASCTSTYTWFVMPILKPAVKHGAVTYKSWNNKAVFVDSDGKMRFGERSRVEQNQLFTEEIVQDGIEKGIKAVNRADYVIVCVGNNPMIVGREEYDREYIELPFFQQELVRNIYMANKDTIMCLISSYPYAIPEFDRSIPAIIYTAHGGPEMGTAVAETVMGTNNPAGRTPMTWYVSTEELPSINDYDIIKTKSTYQYYDRFPLYPFGYGMSYSRFRYGGLLVTDKIDSFTVTVNVENLSNLGGDEVVQIYMSELNSKYRRPLKQLCAFKREFIDALEKKTFTFTVSKREFARWDVVRGDYSFDEGTYLIYAGGVSDDDRCSVKIFLSGNKPVSRDLLNKTSAMSFDEMNGVEIKAFSNAKGEYISGIETFGGKLVFYDCEFNNFKKIEIKASDTGNAADISFETEGERIASIKLPPFVEPEKFKSFELDIEKEVYGVHDLTVSLGKGANILSFKFVAGDKKRKDEDDIETEAISESKPQSELE